MPCVGCCIGSHSQPLHLVHTAARGRCRCCLTLLALQQLASSASGAAPEVLCCRARCVDATASEVLLPAFAGLHRLLTWRCAAALQCWREPRLGGCPQRGSPMHLACFCRMSSALPAMLVWIQPGRRRGGHRLHVSFLLCLPEWLCCPAQAACCCRPFAIALPLRCVACYLYICCHLAKPHKYLISMHAMHCVHISCLPSSWAYHILLQVLICCCEHKYVVSATLSHQQTCQSPLHSGAAGDAQIQLSGRARIALSSLARTVPSPLQAAGRPNCCQPTCLRGLFPLSGPSCTACRSQDA